MLPEGAAGRDVSRRPPGRPGRRRAARTPITSSRRAFWKRSPRPSWRSSNEHAGPVILQFPPAPSTLRPDPAAFAERLGRFLAALPKSLSYAVELRDPALLTEDYREALAANGAAHVYNYSGTMPMPAEQAKIVPIETAPFVVIRLLMPPGNRYEERRDALAPFNRLSAPDDRMRREVAALALAASATHRPVSILVNNKAEGCSPLTIRALAEILAEQNPLS